MLTFMFDDINYVSVLVAPIITLVLGFIWYGPLFGKQWMDLVGLDEEKIKESNMVRTFGVTILNALILSFIIALILNLANQTVSTTLGTLEALLIADLLWVTFAAATLTNAIFAQGSLKLWLLESAYWLLSFMAIAVIHIAWT